MVKVGEVLRGFCAIAARGNSYDDYKIVVAIYREGAIICTRIKR